MAKTGFDAYGWPYPPTKDEMADARGEGMSETNPLTCQHEYHDIRGFTFPYCEKCGCIEIGVKLAEAKERIAKLEAERDDLALKCQFLIEHPTIVRWHGDPPSVEMIDERDKRIALLEAFVRAWDDADIRSDWDAPEIVAARAAIGEVKK